MATSQHMLHHLAPTGTMVSLLANGSLSTAANGEDAIRKAMVEGELLPLLMSGAIRVDDTLEASA